MACGGTADTADADPWVDPSADDDWSGQVETLAHAPVWTAEQVADQIETALSTGLPLPQPIFDGLAELLTHGDAGCPGSYFEDGFLKVGICTSDEGYQFSGAAGVTTDDNRVTEDDGSWTGSATRRATPFDFLITRPDGTALAAGGSATQRLMAGPEGINWETELSGTFRDDRAQGWLGEGYSGGVRIYGTDIDSPVRGEVSGYLTILGVSLKMERVEVNADTCPDGVLGGTLALRQDDSTWYAMTLPDSCGGCAEVVWDDQVSLGEACPDLSAFVTSVAEAEAW
jgi:hypothetical protein